MSEYDPIGTLTDNMKTPRMPCRREICCQTTDTLMPDPENNPYNMAYWQNYCELCSRTASYDVRGELHNPCGPAVNNNGEKLYYLHGKKTTGDVIAELTAIAQGKLL